ncbi:hypothetical protein [Streptomyces sp. SJL17-1]|uniref:hypothetical protein n=1 Tax=Streptomyces sp. SJL17-1 TaxID=2967223 RepID=UPI00296764B3|nr:hypothetical protein [Streptomyces sp. SJL17-1]
MTSTFARSCAAALFLVAVATGCAGRPATGPATDPGPGPGPAHEVTDTDRTLLRHTEQVLVERCMRAQGFSYWAGPRPTPDESFTVGYLLKDTDWARKNGYGSRVGRKVLAARKTDPNLRYVDGLSPERRAAYLKALEGGPGSRKLSVEAPGGGTIKRLLGGCEESAQVRLYGDPATWFRVSKVATNLTPLYVAELSRDPEFTRAQRAWSVCMRTAGQDYATPGAARDALPVLTRGLPEADAFATEVRLAVTEAECAGSSGFARTGSALVRRYVDGLRGEYGDELDAYARLEREALTRARSLT